MLAQIVTRFLHIYATSTTYFEKYVLQGYKTWVAIVNSFSTQSLIFLEDSQNIAVCKESLLIPQDTSVKYTWMYVNGIFYNSKCEPTPKAKSFPWMSLSLIKNNSEVADLTTWLETKKYIGPSPPSFDIIIQSWMYDTCFNINSFELYSVKLLNETVEEETHPLRQKIH